MSLADWKARLQAAGLRVAGEKPVNYGVQLRLDDGESEALLTVYQGKKGESVVVGGRDSACKRRLQELAGGGPPRSAAPPADGRAANKDAPPGFEEVADFSGPWIGTDESGKGDFFGPLVVAGVAVDEEVARQLVAAGVKDCKLLADAQNFRLAQRIRECCDGRFFVLALAPGPYNQWYAKLRGEGKNLNHLLAWMHGKVLGEVAAQQPLCRFALVDRFAKPALVQQRLGAQAAALHLVQQPGAERNVAVAAASILARQEFLEGLQALGESFGMNFPKGASPQVAAAARRFVASFGRERLGEVAKTHFRTAEKL